MADIDLSAYLKQNEEPPAVDLHQYLSENDALTPEQKIQQANKISNEKADTENAYFIDTLLMNHLPHVKAKLGQIFAGEGISNDEEYVKRRDEEIAAMKEMGEKYPFQKLKGQAFGFLAPMMFGGIGGAAKAGAEAAAETLPFSARLAESAVKAGKAGAVYGALQNPGDVEGQVDPLQAKERIENAIHGMKFGAALGVGVPVAAEAIVRSKAPAKWLAKKVASVLGSIPEETTERYMSNPSAIRSAPERQQIAEDILTLKDKADAEVADAHQAVAEARQNLLEKKAEVQAAHADNKFDASERLREAQRDLDQKTQQLRTSLRDNDLNHMTAETVTAVEELKDKVVEGSQKGYEILGKSKAKVSVDPIINKIRKERAGLQINGVLKSPEAEAAATALQNEEQRLFDMTKESDGKLSMSQAKEMIQEWDKRTKKSYEQGAGAFNETEAAALKQARGKLDEIVKTKVPEYRDHMANEVAPLADLLGQVKKTFGKSESAVSALNSITTNKGKTITLPMLEKLGKATGRDLSTAAAEMIENKKILSDPTKFEQILSAENKTVRAAQEELQRLRNPETIREEMGKALSGPQAEREATQAALEKAKSEKKTFTGITPNTISGQTRQLGGANDFAAQKRFGGIDERYGTNFREQIRNRNDLDQFKKTDQAGSRKTALGGITGWVVGTLMDHPLAGIEIGAAAGAAADKFSGAVIKSGLDVGMAGGRAAQKVAEGLQKSERAIPAISGAAARLQITPENQKKGPVAWVNSGFDKISEHAKGEDLSFINAQKEEIMKDPQARELLMQASDLKPGSKAMDDVLRRLKQRMSKGGK